MIKKERQFFDTTPQEVMYADILGPEVYEAMVKARMFEPRILKACAYELFVRPNSLVARRYTERVRKMCITLDEFMTI